MDTRSVLGLALSVCAKRAAGAGRLRRLPDVGRSPARVLHRTHRQPRRDRRAGDTDARAASASARRWSTATLTPESRHVREADVAVRIGPAEAALQLSRHRRGRGSRSVGGSRGRPSGLRLPVRERRLRRAPARRRDWCSSARRPRRSRPWGTRSGPSRPSRRPGLPWCRGATTQGSPTPIWSQPSAEIGYPVLLKPSAGGGGKGMRRVDEPADAPRRGGRRLDAKRVRPSATTPSSSNASSTAPATSRCRCSPTRSGPCCTWASGSAACSAGTRRSSRRLLRSS